jgi:hypothetical protein
VFVVGKTRTHIIISMTTVPNTATNTKEEATQRAFMRAAGHMDDGSLGTFRVTNPALFDVGAYLVVKSAYAVVLAPDDDGENMDRLANRLWRRWQSLLCTYAIDARQQQPCLTPWDTLHRYCELGGGAALDSRCRLILGALGRTGRCDFNSSFLPPLHYEKEGGRRSPLLFAIQNCGPKTVNVLGEQLDAAFAPHEDGLTAIAEAPLDVLLAFKERVPGGIPDLHRRIANRPYGGTLLHAICANPLSSAIHIAKVGLRTFEGDVWMLDDALRSPRDLLRARGDPALHSIMAIMAARERREHAIMMIIDWRTAATLIVARRKGLTRELAQRLAKHLRVV